MPVVAIRQNDWHDRKEGICYLTDWDFKSSSGCAYVSNEANDIITLIVHGNSNYDLRITP